MNNKSACQTAQILKLICVLLLLYNLSGLSFSVPYKKHKRHFDASLQLDTCISFTEKKIAVLIRPTQLCCCLMVDVCIKNLFSMHF